MKTALITGASSGIGWATAKKLAENNFKLILCGRRRGRLEALSRELPEHSPVQVLSFDIRNRIKIHEALRELPPDFCQIDILINNAGNAHGLEPIFKGDPDDWDAMIDINVKGLLYISREIIPGMVSRRKGHIINIGSTAAKEVYPNGNVYCASKHAVDALNQAMRIDLNEFGIKVGAIHPGLTQTEFSQVRFRGDTKRAMEVYKGFEPLQARDIATIIHFVLSLPYHVNIADLTVVPTAQANSTTVRKEPEGPHQENQA